MTSRRLVLSFDQVQYVDRDDILTAAKTGLLSSGVKVQVRDRGELGLSGVKPEGIAEELAALLSQPAEAPERALPSVPAAPALPAPSGLTATDPLAVPAQPDVLEQIRKLGELRDAGILTGEEFAAKKADLLKRL